MQEGVPAPAPGDELTAESVVEALMLAAESPLQRPPQSQLDPQSISPAKAPPATQPPLGDGAGVKSAEAPHIDLVVLPLPLPLPPA